MKPQLSIELDSHIANDDTWEQASRDDILMNLHQLGKMHESGELGGEIMPEDVHPALDRGSAELYHYFTLVMALNYQRDSYSLWRSANSAFNDPRSRKVFDPKAVVEMTRDELAEHLVTHRIALQQNKHPEIWFRICTAICDLLDGDIRTLFRNTNGQVTQLLEFVQKTHKPLFPYLSGPKIANYWLYVMDQYTDVALVEKEALSVAPDTHVIQASVRLGLIPHGVRGHPEVRQIVSEAWRSLLAGTGVAPIDIHTRLWLWSRSGFVPILSSES